MTYQKVHWGIQNDDMTFEETGLQPEIIAAVTDQGFTQPTEVQEKAIPYILETSKDLIALAQTGTGKTAAFGLPLIQKIDLYSKDTQVLVLSPTRELAIQITKDLNSYAKYMKGLKITPVYGGTSITTQITALRKGSQIVVGTPGRILDLIKRKVLKLKNVNFLVLDEADEMLNMGFQEDLDRILAETPQEKQTLLFSATMPKEIARITKKYMRDAQEITIGQKNKGADKVTHHYYVVHARDRFSALKRIIDIHPNIYGIIFCRTRRECNEISKKLIKESYNADVIHGDLSQAQRDHVMDQFREKTVQLLVATDVAARGLDVNDLTHVINYELPDELEVYIHRSGRTGRAGKSGMSLSILHTRELYKVKQLERMSGKSFERKMIPTGREICEKQLYKLVDKVEKVKVDEQQIASYMPVIFEKLSWLERDELIKHFISVEFNRFLKYYRNAPDLNVQAGRQKLERTGETSRDRRDGRGFARFYVNIGKKHGLTAARFIGLVNDILPRRRAKIGKIEILDKISFIEVENRLQKELISGANKALFDNKSVVFEISEPRKDSKFKSKSNSRPKNFKKKKRFKKKW